MQAGEFWKNFELGEELQIAGTFIYNGLRRFHELRKLDNPDEIFEVLYNLSVGIERLLKIAVVLLEHTDATDQEAFEKSLITHSHHDLIRRVKKHAEVNLGPTHNAFLSLLTTFYKTFRYDRFSLRSVKAHGKERTHLLDFLEKHLGAKFGDRDSIFGVFNEERFSKFVRKTVLKISSTLYVVIATRARDLNLYTYELRSGSRAETVFLGEADIPAEDILWKELLIFFMNTDGASKYLDFIRGIEPLNFDPALVGDYLDCFGSDSKKAAIMDELEALYEEVGNKAARLEMLSVVGAPGVSFDDDDSEDVDIENLDDEMG